MAESTVAHQKTMKVPKASIKINTCMLYRCCRYKKMCIELLAHYKKHFAFFKYNY